ncbi:hypothetical protein DOM21_08975 [Bacteriovorax stolpii]|uniref:hypothetical protein n=1 Tax=Bacteriovorax stolpii TaxID=960 RepID=UPI00115ACD7E|nr:hypothetical protein [Bacteriovorax stolpii]QDK41582.1 hypothetical protein DOM21_08975 [Bacteriovorax stolpii]
MKKIKLPAHFLSVLIMSATLVVVSSCIGDQSVAKRKGYVKDFSTTTGNGGCESSYLIYSKPYDTCTSACSDGYHLASLDELSEVKKELVDSEGYTIDGVSATDILARINNSANICVADVIKDERPTNAIDIKSDFCSCINGKSDIINNCDSFCAAKTPTDQPILYVNTIMGTDIALNTKIGNLHNWCTVQLTEDQTTPGCSLIATDGTNTVSLQMTTSAGSNSFSANVSTLTRNKTWLLKIQETKAGSGAQSKEFQIRRINQASDTTTGVLKVTPINQYTCMTYGGKVDNSGNIIRTTFARIFYYFAANETPAPIPPAGGTNQSQVVCHDEQLHGVTDSAEWDRLELIPGAYSMWDKADTRFVAKAENNNKLTINKTLEERLLSDYNITATIDLFRLLSYPNRPTTTSTSSANIPLGYIMVPFSDAATGKTYCPTATQFNGTQPLLNLLGEFMDDTEGLYLAEKEAETIQDGSTYKVLYGTMFVRETTLKNYGFYIENGIKIKADAAAMHTKTIYFYWPTSTTADPLTQGGRKLFTVRTPSTLNGNVPTGQATTEATTDKRIGCVPKS